MQVRGRRILIVGDSLTHRGSREDPDQVDVTEGSARRSSSPGDLLASRLLESGAAAVRLQAKVGRSIYSFFTKEPGAAILGSQRAWRPDVVLVMLGTNDTGYSVPVSERLFDELKGQLADLEVWAVGPPAFRDAELAGKAAGVAAAMKRVYGDRFVDFRPLTQDLTVRGRAGDGIHFTADGAPIAAERLAKVLVTQGADTESRILLGLGLAAIGVTVVVTGALAVFARGATRSRRSRS